MIRGTFLSILADALAFHEPMLGQLVAEQMSRPAAGQRPAETELASIEDYFPSVNDLIVADGVALMPLHGMMVKRSQILDSWFSSRVMIGSDYWCEVMRELTVRSDIHTIVIDADSGGGQVAGTEQLGDAIYAARQEKTVIFVVNEFAASACLWAGSQATRIVTPATATLGSLGVYRMHFDDTKWMAERGMEKSVVHRGKYKAAEERPLDKENRDDLQRYIDVKYSAFIDAVARGRGLSSADVLERWGDSSLYSGSEAVSSGLADEIGTLQDVLDSLKAGRGGRVSIETPADNEGDPEAMKLNAQGQVLDTAGKVVGNVSELQIDAAGLTKHFGTQASELIDSAVKTAKDAAEATQKAAIAEAIKAGHATLDALVAAVGADKAIVAFKAGDSVEKAKAGLADDLAAALKAKDEEIAKLKAGVGSTPAGKAPGFVATDAGQSGAPKTPAAKSDDPNAEFVAAWDANTDGCQDRFPSVEAYGAFQRYSARRSG